MSFTGDYPELIGNFKKLGSIPVNKTEALAHLVTLANYRATGPDQLLKIPLAFFVLTICEAERFVPIRQPRKSMPPPFLR